MGPPASHQTAVVLLDACTSVGGRASTPSCSTHPALPSFTLLHRIPLADTLTLMFLNPAICALLGWALLAERASWRTAAGWVLLAGSLASSTPLQLRLAASTVLMTVLWDAALGCICKSPQLPVTRLSIKLPALPPHPMLCVQVPGQPGGCGLRGSATIPLWQRRRRGGGRKRRQRQASRSGHGGPVGLFCGRSDAGVLQRFDHV